MPVNEPPVQALSPDAQEAAYSDGNHQQLEVMDGPEPEEDDKPGWLERLEKAKESRGNVALIDGEEYRIGKMLGKGTFGVVFEGEKLSTEGWLAVAIKFVGDLPRLTIYNTKQRLTCAATRNREDPTILSYETSIVLTGLSPTAVNRR